MKPFNAITSNFSSSILLLRKDAASNLRTVLNNAMFKHAQRGQSISEYGIILALVALVAIPVLLSLGQTSTQQINTLQSHQTQLNDLSLLAAKQAGGNYTITTGPAIAGTQPVLITLKDGTQLNFLNFPTDAGLLVETLGPNGTSELLTNTLRQLGQRLFNEGKISQDEANQFSALANGGHTLGQGVQAIENINNQCIQENKKDCSDELFPAIEKYAKPTVPVKELDPAIRDLFRITNQIQQFVLDENGNPQKDSQGNFVLNPANVKENNISKDQVEFLKRFESLLQKPALADSTLKNLVFNLSKNILMINGNTGYFGNVAAYKTYNMTSNDFKEKLSTSIHKDSQNICSLGNGKDTGVYCPPTQASLPP
ncbi:MAG: hypothetical protein K2X66_05865 [Cyanobacteria bacterium]|nr:hypothetical protein [Cyanobacteriota bacterium]